MFAFCFLLYDKVQHGELWKNFFSELKNLRVPFSIYTHPKKITKNTQSWVKKNSIKTIKTTWGDYSLLEASMLMYKEAFKNRKNKYFVLLSGADIPLHGAEYIIKKMMKDDKSYLDIRYNEEYRVWAASQWMYLSRNGAKQLIRLLNPKDRVAKKFLEYWKPETDPNEEDCHVCKIYGADEAIPVNWFIHLYGSPNSKEFRKYIKNSCVTYAYFRTRFTQSPKIWKAPDLTPYRRWEMSKCLFGRKYEKSAIKKLFKNQKFTREQLNSFRIRKKRDGPKAHWGQPQK